ncbi:hypothetical protein [Dictyobacter aurantiacus]|uniref:Uncharacterized protein n=1 Tax=Dictyobacter aurantiacus TaxID=1936993 RepID=A0A401ZDR9_9CHLR|nr:hypothetical protein [Dictyobacter aurantiacus]GCE04995.1 hypothetical protein KDAU_23240 [Dictyobacter aurantiacus]
MSQQEFMPEPQRERVTNQGNEEIYTQSYSQYRASSDMPKRDHPADFEATIPPYSYQARDHAERREGEATGHTTYQHPHREDQRPHQAFPRMSRIGTTFQQGYRFYKQRRQRFDAPEGGRPMSQAAPAPRWGVLLLLGLVFLCALPILIKLLLLLFAAMIVMGFISLLLILGGLIIYHLYIKKCWRALNSRWRWW